MQYWSILYNKFKWEKMQTDVKSIHLFYYKMKLFYKMSHFSITAHPKVNTIKIQNSHPEQHPITPSSSAFECSLNSNVWKPSPLYFHGSRNGQVLHTSLRLGCSSLNYDLYRKSITDTPHCSCGAVETTNHFLLTCPQYRNQRQRLISTLQCPETFQNFLTGLKYILATGRFNL